MKSLIIGDLHSQFYKVREGIEQILKEEKIEHIIFLGDYVDKRGFYDSEDKELEEKLLKDLNDLVFWKRNLKIKSTFLCGNHDYAYISNNMFPTTKTKEEISKAVESLLLQLNLKASVLVNNFLCSHAGINQQWWNKFIGKRVDISSKADDYLNFIFDSYLENRKMLHPNPFELVSKYRGGFDQFSSPFWCDIKELMVDFVPECKQIVGHTPVLSCINILEGTGNELYACDTFSELGDYSVLILDAQNVTVKKLNRV